MDPNFKPFRTGMILVKEKLPCGHGNGGEYSKGRNRVYYLCQCDCGKEFIVSGDVLAHHPYSCGCTKKPIVIRKHGKHGLLNRDALGLVDGTMLCQLKPNKPLRTNNKSGAVGVSFHKPKNKWRAEIGFKGKDIHLGYFDTKEEAIKARKEAEKKYYEPMLLKAKKDEGK